MHQQPDTRVFIEADLAQRAAIALAAAQTHYIKSVLRLKEGAVVALFNGLDGEFLARIESLRRSACTLSIEARSRAQTADTDLWLVFAPIKRARIDFLVEKATELGVSALYPVMTRYTMVERVNL